MILKNYIKGFLAALLTLSMISAVVPLHNILHEHHFVKLDDCGLNSCENHLKTHNEHCHTHSDAVFLAALPKQNIGINVNQPIKNVITFFKEDNYLQFFYLTKNKAPPIIIIA